ncbi:DUF6221 family protein [Arthrobacter sp. 31Y]|uniref:DUF6221 family protein n=1 Tax=Arthrobacter sp. 31Y TaxID=1115632 RepID=UPI0004637825|nr:DUF6221 family protein [Arthrobacter sp. 31Y]
MSDLIGFLEARIAEDERRASYVREYGDAAAAGLFSPDRAIAECEAKRAIVDAASGYSPELEHGDNGEWAFDVTLKALAAVYSDHPDYQQEWGAL